MTIKQGYKLTEVGVIPEDWIIKSLYSITLDMLQGVNTAIDIPEYVDSGYPILKANNIIDGEVNFATSDHISARTYHRYNDRFKIKKGDFLFSNIGARLGTGSLMKTETECSFAWNVMRIIPNQKVLKSEFLGCVMNSPTLFKQIKQNESGSGMGFVPKNVLQTLVFPLPPTLTEQTAIANALSDADSYINSLTQLIAKKQHIKQGTMQNLLTGKQRLAGFSGEWEEKQLGNLTYNISSGRSSTINDGFSYPIWGSTGIIGYSKKHDYSGNKILIARVGANAGKVNKVFGHYCISDNTIALTLNDILLDFDFCCYVLHHYNLNKIVFGSGQPLITGTQLKDLSIVVPITKKEQTAIAQILSDMDLELEQLQAKLAKARSIKQGMMQQLLTGQIRLVTPISPTQPNAIA